MEKFIEDIFNDIDKFEKNNFKLFKLFGMNKFLINNVWRKDYRNRGSM